MYIDRFLIGCGCDWYLYYYYYYDDDDDDDGSCLLSFIHWGCGG